MASPFTNPLPSPPPPLTKSNLPMLYYGLIVIGTATIVLVLYNLIIIRWCADRGSQTSPRQNTIIEIAAAATRTNSGNGTALLPSSFKYKKEIGIGSGGGGGGGGGDSNECAVCLSAFEEGEEIRKLPRCRHCFHAPCIDMWLYSHSDCPLCRTPVVSSSLRCHRHVATAAAEESSREVLLGSTTVTVRELR